MKLSDIAAILGTTYQGEDVAITSISIDTRDLQPGQLYIALKGDQFDGHNFVDAAITKKAAAIIVAHNVAASIPTIQVADTRIALGKIAEHHRKQFNLPVIGITGSCGKTTTKTMLGSILNHMGSTLSPEKSFNNDIGVPLTLLKLTQNHQYAVVEMGANHPGEIAYLSGVAHQTVAMITNVAPAHLEGFGSVDGVARAKGEIYQGLAQDGYAIINNDDVYAPDWRKALNGRPLLTFGIKNQADVMATNIKLDAEGRANFTVNYPGGNLKISLPVMGHHNVMNALAAISAAHVVGATRRAIEAGLSAFETVGKRLVRYKGQQGSLIIDDTYNANPLSVGAALEILTHGLGEKIFVFGDMGELGKEEEQHHIDVGERARQLGINKLYACGKLTKFTVAAFGENGFYYPDQTSLIAALKETLHANAVILIKGSRSSRMEHVVQALIEDK